MHLQRLVYQKSRGTPGYCEALEANDRNKIFEKDQTALNDLFDRKIAESMERRSMKLVNSLKGMGSVFEKGASQQKQLAKKLFSEYSDEMVEREIDKMYELERRQVEFINEHEDPLTLEDDNYEIYLKRKMRKENLSHGLYTKEKNIAKIVIPEEEQQALSTIRERIESTDRRMSTERNIENDLLRIEERLNQVLWEEVKGEAQKFRGIQVILEDEPEDLINEEYEARRFRNEYVNYPRYEFPHETIPSTLRQESIMRLDNLDTGRSDLESLEWMLKDLMGEEKGFSSRKTQRNIRIKREILENLYDYQGRLRMDIIKKAIQRVRK